MLWGRPGKEGLPLPHHTRTIAPMHRDACLTWVPKSAHVSVGLWQGVHPAPDPLAGVHIVPQAAVTYGQADLQQHCLAFIEGCTTVWLRVMGEHGMRTLGHGEHQGHMARGTLRDTA